MIRSESQDTTGSEQQSDRVRKMYKIIMYKIKIKNDGKIFEIISINCCNYLGTTTTGTGGGTGTTRGGGGGGGGAGAPPHILAHPS